MTGPQLPRDDLGYPVRVARPARRAVSLVPSLTKSVTVTGPNALVGATRGAKTVPPALTWPFMPLAGIR